MLLQLQPLTADLLSAALELDRRCFGGLWTFDGYQRELDSPNSELLVLLPGAHPQHANSPADIGSPLLLGLGCYWAILEEAHITILAIDPRYQRQGLGQALLYALLNSAHQCGLERATLEVRISNQSALSLYQKFGFQEAGRRRRYYQDTGEDALVLWLGGLQQPSFGQKLQMWEQQVKTRLQQAGWESEFVERPGTIAKTRLTSPHIPVNNFPSGAVDQT